MAAPAPSAPSAASVASRAPQTAIPPAAVAGVGVGLLGLGSTIALVGAVIALPAVGLTTAIWICATVGFFVSWRRTVQSATWAGTTPTIGKIILHPRHYLAVAWPTALVVLQTSVLLMFAVLYLGYLAGTAFETGTQFIAFAAVFVPAMTAVLGVALYRTPDA